VGLNGKQIRVIKALPESLQAYQSGGILIRFGIAIPFLFLIIKKNQLLMQWKYYIPRKFILK